MPETFTERLRASRQTILDARTNAMSRKQAALDLRSERGGRKFDDAEAIVYHGAVADIRQADSDLASIDGRIAHQEAEEIRAGRDNPAVQRIKGARGTGHVGPPMFDQQQLRGMHAALMSGSQYRMESRAPIAIDSLYPAQLAPNVIGPQHDTRLLSRLPVVPTESPAIEYIRHNSTTGSAAIVAETAAKPELSFSQDTLTLHMQKFAAHVGVGFESLRDYASYEGYVTGELLRSITDVETAELLQGDGTTGHLLGFTHQSGILTHATATDTPLDSLEIAIATMRTGAALAEPTLMVIHPNTWSAIRRSKDSQERYLVAADPTADEASSVWGVPALVTTACTAGTAVLIDVTKFGRVWMREPLSVMTGYANDDFTKNIRRFVGEERLAIAVERPAAVCLVTGLPVS
jgi:HK97 family phage major capsid protein